MGKLLPVIFILLHSFSFGQIIFQKSYGGSLSEYSSAVRQTSDGGYIMAGTTSSYTAGSFDIYVVKTDSLGNVEWTKSFGGSGSDQAASIEEASDSGYLIIGNTTSFGAGGNDMYVIKIDPSGNMLWSKTYGTSTSEMGLGFLITPNGFIAVGSSGYDVFDQDAVQTAKRIAPYDKFPQDSNLQELEITIPIVYSLQKK